MAAAVGVLLGAHVGMVGGAVLGAIAYLPFVQEGGGGWDVLIGAFFGVIGGGVVGGGGGAAAALRVRNHQGAGRTAWTAFAGLLVGAVLFVGVFLLARDGDLSGWSSLVAFEGPILLVALLVRRLTPARD